MHEESLMRSLLRQVEELAERECALAVEVIEVEIGPLSGVESLLLSSAFDRLKHTARHCSNATLTIQNVQLMMKCRDCECEFALQEFKFVCRQCGSISLKTLRGDALRLLNVQLRIEDSAAVSNVDQDVLADRTVQAEELRAWFTEQGTLVVNLVSSPGAGKTTLLQATARYWKNRYRMAVLVGDLATDRDAERLRPFVPVEQLTTGGACHLELPLIHQGLARLPRQSYEFLFIENIGNLVCPASHDLGEHLRVVVLSSTEGDDKPGKYPKMFRTSHAMVISKCDLMPYVPFSATAACRDARLVQPELTTILTSAIQDDGLHDWCQYLSEMREIMIASRDAPANQFAQAARPSP